MRAYRDSDVRSINKPLMVLVIVAGHAWLIYAMLHLKYPGLHNGPVPILTYISLPETKIPPQPIEPPSVNLPPPPMALPSITAPANIVIETPQPAVVTQGMSAADGSFSGVFDPKLRQKLQAAQLPARVSEFQIDEHWVGADGRTYIYLGNGECAVSMVKLDARERGTQWASSRVPCGKNDSEKAMDRVMADFESKRGRPRP